MVQYDDSDMDFEDDYCYWSDEDWFEENWDDDDLDWFDDIDDEEG